MMPPMVTHGTGRALSEDHDMSRKNSDRTLRINGALVWTGTTVLGLTTISFALGSAYRTMQAMSYETMPPVQPETLYALVAAVAVGTTMLGLGSWGWYCSANRDRVGANVAKTSLGSEPVIKSNLATAEATTKTLEDEERAPTLVSSSVG
jgi:hypothetical protein